MVSKLDNYRNFNFEIDFLFLLADVFGSFLYHHTKFEAWKHCLST